MFNRISRYIKLTSLNNRRLIRYTLSLCIFIVLLYSCSSVNTSFGLKDDNFIEELIEKQLEKNTGLYIDLTPGTKEV